MKKKKSRVDGDKPAKSEHIRSSLQEAYENVCVDVELSRREGWCFGAKLVRGAYMLQERSRAKEIGYEDPINPDYESTSQMYQMYVLASFLKHGCAIRAKQCVCRIETRLVSATQCRMILKWVSCLPLHATFLQVSGLRTRGDQQEQESQHHGGVTQYRHCETHNPEVGMQFLIHILV